MDTLKLMRSIVDIRRFTTPPSFAAVVIFFPFVPVASSFTADEPAIDPGWLIVLALRRLLGLPAGQGICVVGSGSASTFEGKVMSAQIAQMVRDDERKRRNGEREIMARDGYLRG